MNITTSFIAIVSLLLALATADTATKQQSQEQSPAAAASPSKIALNHNETMVSDAPLAQDASLWDRWVTSVQAFFLSKPFPGGCDEWVAARTITKHWCATRIAEVSADIG